jgi:hypothetical protein
MTFLPTYYTITTDKSTSVVAGLVPATVRLFAIAMVSQRDRYGIATR